MLVNALLRTRLFHFIYFKIFVRFCLNLLWLSLFLYGRVTLLAKVSKVAESIGLLLVILFYQLTERIIIWLLLFLVPHFGCFRFLDCLRLRNIID